MKTSSRPMWLGYKGYVIEVTAKQKYVLWAADAWIGLVIQVPGALRCKVIIEGYSGQGEAEGAAMLAGIERVDIILEGKPPIRTSQL